MIVLQCMKCVISWMINFYKSTRMSKIIIIYVMMKKQKYQRVKNNKLKFMLINKKSLFKSFMILSKKQ